MTRAILTGTDLAKLVTDLIDAGTRVVAPVPVGPSWEHTEYRPIERLEEVALDGGQPRRSLKEFFRSSAQDERGRSLRQVVLGAHPCDAAGLHTLDHVMGWDYRDDGWRARRNATTIVTVSCQNVERSCFCSAVGGGPASARGADVLLLPVENAPSPAPQRRRINEQLRQCVEMFLLDSQPFPGAAELQARGEPAPPPPLVATRWVAQAQTAKGEALLRGRGSPCLAGEVERAEALARRALERVEQNAATLRLGRAEENVVPLRPGRGRAWIDPDTEARLGIMAADGGELLEPPRDPPDPGVARVGDWLARNFDHEVWRTVSRRCRGCGSCAAVCSTSACFEDLDRAATGRDGVSRVRLGLGASGAGPKRTERFRERVIQKFSTYSRRFDGVQCTGCGRCSRACEGGIDLPAFLGELVGLAAPEPRAAT
jgi:ferredoxin